MNSNISATATLNENYVIQKRINSIDFVRGLVMVIMTLDHVRDFFHETAMTQNPLNINTTYPGLFFTRWITHFCAPIFLFLSGLSAYIGSFKMSPKEFSKHLIRRGFALIFIEILIVTFALSFNPNYNVIILQVIWAIGCSMIFLGLVIRCENFKLVVIIGISIIFLHNTLDFLPYKRDGILGALLSGSGFLVQLNKTHFIGFFYTIIPWTGIMLAGYGFGIFFTDRFSEKQRRKTLWYTGLCLVLLFIVLRSVNIYGDPLPFKSYENIEDTILSFVNVSKYPPSLQFTLMTLGPCLMILSYSERINNRISEILRVYGSVPLFYYILHFFLIHGLLVIIFYLSGYTKPMTSPLPYPFFFRPINFGYSLIWIYIISLLITASLYIPCKWFKKYKRMQSHAWLKYI